MRRYLLLVIGACTLPACAFLADPISDVSKAAFSVPIFGDDNGPDKFSNDTVQPLFAQIDIEPGTPAKLPEGDTSDWGAVLAFDQVARQTGGERLLRVEVTGMDIADALDVTVLISSRDPDKRVLGDASTKAPTEMPAACTFAIGPTPDDAALAAHLDGCITAFVDQYGAPVQPEMEISVEPPGGGQGVHEAGSFKASWGQTLHAEKNIGVRCSVATVPDEVKDDADFLTFSNLKLEGAGASTVPVHVYAFAKFYHPTKGRLASGLIDRDIGGGQLYWIAKKMTKPPAGSDMYTEAGNIDPALTPAGKAFLEGAIEAMVADGGFAYACWSVTGPVPRDGFFALSMAGTGSYAVGK